MARSEHLSLRLAREEKESLERLAQQADLSVGQLVRRAIAVYGKRASDDTIRKTEAASPERQRRPQHSKCRESGSRREREVKWLETHRSEIAHLAGHWLVIEGNELIAHGPDFIHVTEQALEMGIKIPFAVRVPDDNPPGVMMGL